jgi:hypothetical protein
MEERRSWRGKNGREKGGGIGEGRIKKMEFEIKGKMERWNWTESVIKQNL